MDIGLVLSGGMAKGAYQIGALKALSEYITPNQFKYISGSSVGALNSYGFATGKLQETEEVWRKICNDNNRVLVSRILRSSFLQNSIVDLYSENDTIPDSLYISLFNLNKKEIVYKDLKNVDQKLVPLYLKASVAMPVYNRAVQIENENFYDGAIIDNIPVFPLLKHKLDYVICIYFDECCYKFENSYFDNRVIKITFPVNNMLKESVIFHKTSIEYMLEQGYKTASFLLKSVFANGIEDAEYIYDYISYQNEKNSNKKLRITGDVLVTNLNKVTQKLTRKKIIV